jgi:hypothetical protein
MKFFISAFAAGMLLLQVSCNSASESASHDVALSHLKTEEVSGESADTIAIGSGFAPEGNDQKRPNVKDQIPVAKAEWDKKIVRHGVLNLEVKDQRSFDKKLRERVTAAGGYIASEEQHDNAYKLEQVLTIKVPVAQFDEVVRLTAEDGDKIIEKRITSEDVTASLFDTKSRMEAKKHVRERYIGLLKQANKMTDILEVEKEINGIQQEIEAAAGRINYLSHVSAYSSIHLTFFQVIDASVVTEEDPSFLSEVKDAFKTGARWSGELLVAAVSVWPLWVTGVFIWMLIKRIKPAVNKSVVK